MEEIFRSFGLNQKDFSVDRIGTGHIHDTYKLVGPESYVLQKINTNVFTKPHVIASNLRAASDYLKKNHPFYLFLSSVLTVDGTEMSFDSAGAPWRLFPYIKNSITVDKVDSHSEAFDAAAAFARLTCNLDGVDISLFKPTIDRFHDLPARYEQFENAVEKTSDERLKVAAQAIEKCKYFQYIVDRYEELIATGTLRLRIHHNDTKINNILIDADTRQPVCVIDLDTLMPGYFIYDVGDMVRTFVSPANEEEKDLDRVIFRKPIYDALVSGYLSEMGATLTEKEKELFPFAGMMMTYIMALRMLSDYLNGDIYYHISYPGQNHVRAGNQLKLLEVLSKSLFSNLKF